MTPTAAAEKLRQHGIAPSAQRVTVATYVLDTKEHPTAEQVLAQVQAALPSLSRATVYNTLNLFVQKGLLRQLVIEAGDEADRRARVVFDPCTEAHHHFVDEQSGRIYDVPWNAFEVRAKTALPRFEISEYQVVLRGRIQGPKRK